MTYKESLTELLTNVATEPNSVFLGEGIINSGRVYGLLNEVPINKCIEMPVAENLIVGCAIGLALKGYAPVVIFQRMDFMTCAADAIINHLYTFEKLSGGRIKPVVRIFAIIGKPSNNFDVGCQHDKDLHKIFEPYISTHYFSNSLPVIYCSEYSSSLVIAKKELLCPR
jgi:pyruvate/2-oxoglutarate/acetoin dehydrogenase E1 component